MKLLLDQDVYAATARYLVALGHEVVSAADLGLSRASDEELLILAHAQGRIFITRDRDFGNLVFVRQLGAGVIYLRILPSTLNAVHAEMGRVLMQYSETELAHAFVVITPDGHRLRRLTHE